MKNLPSPTRILCLSCRRQILRCDSHIPRISFQILVNSEDCCKLLTGVRSRVLDHGRRAAHQPASFRTQGWKSPAPSSPRAMCTSCWPGLLATQVFCDLVRASYWRGLLRLAPDQVTDDLWLPWAWRSEAVIKCQSSPRTSSFLLFETSSHITVGVV